MPADAGDGAGSLDGDQARKTDTEATSAARTKPAISSQRDRSGSVPAAAVGAAGAFRRLPRRLICQRAASLQAPDLVTNQRRWMAFEIHDGRHSAINRIGYLENFLTSLRMPRIS
jgi:hypothetical protein